MDEIKKLVRDVPDFPKEGILFKDITPVLQNPRVFQRVVNIFCDRYAGEKIDKIIGIESRGFILATPLCYEMGIGFVPVRKPGKLPWTKLSEEYVLEYGKDRLEIHADAIAPKDRVLIIDDLLATGGTARAVCDLVERQKATVVSLGFLVELTFLEGRERFGSRDIFSIIQY